MVNCLIIFILCPIITFDFLAILLKTALNVIKMGTDLTNDFMVPHDGSDVVMVTKNYLGNPKSYLERSELKLGDFLCNCRLREMDKNDSQAMHRSYLLDSLYRMEARYHLKIDIYIYFLKSKFWQSVKGVEKRINLF